MHPNDLRNKYQLIRDVYRDPILTSVPFDELRTWIQYLVAGKKHPASQSPDAIFLYLYYLKLLAETVSNTLIRQPPRDRRSVSNFFNNCDFS